MKYRNTNWLTEINWEKEIISETIFNNSIEKTKNVGVINALIQNIEQWWNPSLKELCENKTNLLKIYEYFYAKSVYYHSNLYGTKEEIYIDKYFPRCAWYINKLKSESPTEISNITIDDLKNLEEQIIKNFNIIE